MKKLEIIIKPGRVEKAKAILIACGVGGANFVNVNGFGAQKGKTYTYNGVTYEEHVLPKVKIETIIPDDLVPKLLEELQKEIPVGEYGDGKVFIYQVEDVVRLRTGERGETAI